LTVARRLWLPPCLSLLMVGWGANQFASMLAFYRQEHGFSELAVTSMLGIYVAGLLPALLLGGPASDRAGRRRVAMCAVGLSVLASVAMMFGIVHPFPLFIGRLMAGVATGLAMAATTSWVKELSQPPWDAGRLLGAAARRASLSTTAGFWLGPVASGLVANWAPAPELLPYLVHVVLCLPLVWILARLPETTAAANHSGCGAVPAAGPGSAAPSEPVGHERRFRAVVAPAAPWVFGAGTIGFAVVPGMITDLGEARLLYTTAAVALTLGAGVLVQPLARRLDTAHSARAVLVALSIVLAGLLLGILSAAVQDPWLGLAASALLGAGYGLMLVAGLLETQRIAPPSRLGALTGRYYTLSYLGFLAPTVLAFLALWFDPLGLMVAVTVLCLLSIAVVAVNSRRCLPVPSEVAAVAAKGH
jgi:MFS family permease